MKKLFLLLLLAMSAPAFGQNHYMGLKSGLLVSNVESDIYKNTESRKGFIGGLTYEYKINRSFNLGVDLLYAQRGFRNNTTLVDGSGNVVDENSILKHDYNYFSIPIKGGFSIGEKIVGFVNIGLIPSFLINAQKTYPGIEGVMFDTAFDVTDDYPRYSFEGLLEIGAAYKFENNFLIFTSFDYQHGFTSFTQNEFSNTFDMFHRGMSISVGLRYALKRQ